MKNTEHDKNIALQILELFAKEKCTVTQANEILSYVNRVVGNNATVQVNEEIKALFC